jgi:hypothetical protein
MFRTTFFAAISVLSACSASVAQVEECEMYTKFETASEQQAWWPINDGVMGGLSSGGPRFEDGNMVFQGIINTNGGGFSSIRSGVEQGALASSSGIKMRVRSDGRAYKLTLRSNAAWRGRRVSFQAPIPQTSPGEWTEVEIPFPDLKGTIFGRPVRGAKFDKSRVVELGIIIADGQDGPFRLDIDWIADCAI